MMALSGENTLCPDYVMQKNIQSLRKSVHQTKGIIIDKLNKSKQTFKEEIDATEEDDKKSILIKKLEKISRELNILDNLVEDDIVKFALTTQHKLMTVASNRRMPLTIRMKARVASHKPLSTHLSRIKSKLQESKNNESEDNSSEEEENEAESSKHLDKMCLNNQIVKMRENVKRAKVHIIHKLTRNIKKLRSSKGKNEEKYKKKADRLVKKIQCLKELNIDDISKFALSSTQDLTKLSIDVKTSLKMQVMATVAVHKFLSANVADFKSKYPDWNKSVPTLLKKIKKKRRLRNTTTKDDKEDIKALNKESKAIKIKSDTELLESEEEKDSEGVSELSGEESERSTNNEHEENVQSSESEIDEKEDSHNELSSEEKSDLDENHQHVKSKSNKNNKKIHCKNENKPSIKNIASDKDSKIPRTRKNVESSKENKTIIQKVVDPFFVTSTNEEYVSSQVPSAVDDHSNWRSRNTSFEYREYKSYDKNNRKWGAKEIYSKHNKFSKFNNQPYKKPTFNHFDKGPVHNNFKTTNKLIIGNRKARRSALHHPVQEEKLEKLHPSWEAKKKLSSLASFKGKKTTFD